MGQTVTGQNVVFRARCGVANRAEEVLAALSHDQRGMQQECLFQESPGIRDSVPPSAAQQRRLFVRIRMG